MFKPFYNVEQTTEFTFHFNSNVDPVKAITVHTDSKCEENSTVYQINDGYKTSNGVDVVVKPREAVLASDDRLDASKDGWGYAPIYYLCVRYDLDSNEVKELDEPIVIPFTVKNDINIPNAYANIDNKGNFTIKWDAVDGATSYRIYRALPPNTSELRQASRAEYAYVGDDPVLEETVSASTLEFIDEPETNLLLSTGEYVSRQNDAYRYSYYITAVDSKGNESFFSKPVSIWKYAKNLPYKVTSESLGTSSSLYLEEFKETVGVTSRDDETIVNYPINYYKIGTPNTFSNTCEYRYEIVGTELTGKVTYRNSENDFPEEHLSEFKVSGGMESLKETDSAIPTDASPIIDENYGNSNIDLSQSVNYPETAKIICDPAILVIRSDIEAARVIRGYYTKSLDTIESYIATENPEYILVIENGTITVREATDSDFVDSTPIVNDQAKTEEPAKEIDNTNYVEEQRKSTEEQVKEADKETVTDVSYPIYANTAGQKYLALKLIEQEENISLKAFPQYQNAEKIKDDVAYVYYQNPYVMGMQTAFTYDYNTQTLKVKYLFDDATAERQRKEVYEKANKIVNEIIKPSMTDYEKVVAIYDYLETNSEYNYVALEGLKAGDKDIMSKYPNSWTTYGILCEEKGVCLSYAYAFKILADLCDVESVVVTGSSGNIGHAWNAVKLDNLWYMVDTTNNVNAVGLPYWICAASYDFIEKNGFTLNEDFVEGDNYSEFLVNDDTEDWYYANELMPSDNDELVDIWLQNINSNEIYMKYWVENQEELNTIIKELENETIKLYQQGNTVYEWNMKAGGGIFVMKKGEILGAN